MFGYQLLLLCIFFHIISFTKYIINTYISIHIHTATKFRLGRNHIYKYTYIIHLHHKYILNKYIVHHILGLNFSVWCLNPSCYGSVYISYMISSAVVVMSGTLVTCDTSDTWHVTSWWHMAVPVPNDVLVIFALWQRGDERPTWCPVSLWWYLTP